MLVTDVNFKDEIKDINKIYIMAPTSKNVTNFNSAPINSQELFKLEESKPLVYYTLDECRPY